MKKYLLFASAIIAFASCTSESYNGTEEDLRSAAGDKAITFAFDVPTATRASGSEAATKLNQQFIVWGEKGEPTTGSTGAAYSANATDDHQLVFKNYVVNYSDGSDYTTTSNTKGWEYVGITPAYGSYVSPEAGETQTIKYWDFGASNYVFTAVSALPDDINSGRVTIEKTQSGTTAYEKGYTVTLAKTGSDPDYVYPSLADLYFSDRNVITAKGSNRDTPNQYGGNATMTFRNSLTQVRVGMFEDIPGYAVSAISFKVTSDAAAVSGSDPAFGAICPNVKADNFEGTITVTYYDNTFTTENQPKLEIAPAAGLTKTDLILGTNINAITTAAPLSTSAASPTWDTSGGAYTSVLPQIANDQNLKLKVNYTLYNATTGETITVENATAEIDKEYLQWKPNYKYTYLFKISDNGNGYTGPNTDPAGLYPITFDAVEIIAEDGQAEYITTVSEPTITTFGVNSSTGKYVYGGSEYAAGSDIYATFMEGSAVKTPTLGGTGAQHVNVYAVTTPDATNFPITEASVAEAVAAPAASITNDVWTYDEGTSTYSSVAAAADLEAGITYYKADANTVEPGESGYVPTVAVAGTDYQVGPKLTVTNINDDDTANFTDEPEVVDEVPGEDGVDITQKALKLTGVKATTSTTAYAIEYEASAAWTGTYKKVYKVIRVQ